jgi:hypothetical protein
MRTQITGFGGRLECRTPAARDLTLGAAVVVGEPDAEIVALEARLRAAQLAATSRRSTR